MSMRFAVFCTGAVGVEVLSTFSLNGHAVHALVLDDRGDPSFNQALSTHVAARGARQWRSSEVGSDAFRRFLAEEIDLGILAWWPYLIRQPVISAPRNGFLNLHPSLLPFNRGKHYNFWALVEQCPFGVSIHFVDEGIDSGDIAFQRALSVGWEDSGETLYRRAQTEIAALFAESFPRIARGDIPRIKQDLRTGSLHYAHELEAASRIDLELPQAPRALLNLLRARTFPPHPAAWFEADGERYEVRISITRKRKDP